MASLSRWYVGQTAPKWQPPLLYDNGATVDLTNTATTGAIALTIRNLDTGVDRAGTGTWTYLRDATGTASYAWTAADVASSGHYQLLVDITFTDGTILKFDPVEWDIFAR